MISAGALGNIVIYSLQIGVIIAGASLLPSLLRLEHAGARPTAGERAAAW